MATKMKGKVNVGKVDVTENHPNPLSSRFGVEGYPTINFFPPGEKTESNFIKYKGKRESISMISFAKRKIAIAAGDTSMKTEDDSAVYILDEDNWD